MAKATPAARPAAKKSSKAKIGTTKRKKGKGGTVDDRPIIVKGHALPTQDRKTKGRRKGFEDPDPFVSVVVGAQEFGFDSGGPPEFPKQYNYALETQPPIVLIELFIDNVFICDKKVEGTNWSIIMHTV